MVGPWTLNPCILVRIQASELEMYFFYILRCSDNSLYCEQIHLLKALRLPVIPDPHASHKRLDSRKNQYNRFYFGKEK